jgi:hypothetical protein
LPGVNITSAGLFGDGLGGPTPERTKGVVTELNWSSFTDEGLACIERSRDVRIDLSRLPTDAASLGLAADDTTTIGPSVAANANCGQSGSCTVEYDIPPAVR